MPSWRPDKHGPWPRKRIRHDAVGPCRCRRIRRPLSPRASATTGRAPGPPESSPCRTEEAAARLVHGATCPRAASQRQAFTCTCRPPRGLIRTSRPAFPRTRHGLFHGGDNARDDMARVVLFVDGRARRGRSGSGWRLGERRGREEAQRPVHQCAAATATSESVRRYGCRRRQSRDATARGGAVEQGFDLM